MADITIQDALKLGIKAHKDGKLQEADRYYTAILKVQPQNPDANHNMGVLAVSLDKTEQALSFFKNALEVNPSLEQYWVSMINALIKLDRLDDARALLNQANSEGINLGHLVDLVKKTNDGHHTSPNTGLADEKKKIEHLINIGEFDQALDILLPSISNNGDNLEYLSFVTKIYLQKNDTQQASKFLKKSKNLGKTNLNTTCNEIELLVKTNKIKKALVEAKRAHKKYPESVAAFNVLGLCLRLSGKVNESILILNEALKRAPNSTEALVNRGLSKLESQDRFGALTDLENAYKNRPSITQIWTPMIKLKFELQQYISAIQLMDTMLELEPENALVLSSMALCYYKLEDYKKSIELNKKAIELFPNSLTQLTNLANAFMKCGKFNEALETIERAILIKPNQFEALLSKSVIHGKLGNYKEALKVYEKITKLRPKDSMIFFNIGVLHYEHGALEKSVESYEKAISVDTKNISAWNNLYYALKALNVTPQTLSNYSSLWKLSTQYSEIFNATLNYKLFCGDTNSIEHYLNAVAKFSKFTDAQPKKNLGYESGSNTVKVPGDVIAMVGFGRSGTGLIHSLFDGHPSISTLPSIYFSQYFDPNKWEELMKFGPEKLVEQFASIYDVFFDSRSNIPITNKSGHPIHNIGVSEGMTTLGDNKEYFLKIDKVAFCTELRALVYEQKSLDPFLFFTLIHQVYNKIINDYNAKKLIFYHIHNPNSYALLNFSNFVPNAKFLMVIREPIQSLESWIRSDFECSNYTHIISKITELLYEVDSSNFGIHNSVAVRLEDIKSNSKITLGKLCSWMGIDENDALYNMTAQGLRWWGDPTSPYYHEDGMNPFGHLSLKRKVGEIFSEKDQFILRTLFYPFNVQFGYEDMDQQAFINNLIKIRPLIDGIFDFERSIIEKMNFTQENFMISGSYQFFRTCLRDRWETLNKFKTYPGMISPL